MQPQIAVGFRQCEAQLTCSARSRPVLSATKVQQRTAPASANGHVNQNLFLFLQADHWAVHYSTLHPTGWTSLQQCPPNLMVRLLCGAMPGFALMPAYALLIEEATYSRMQNAECCPKFDQRPPAKLQPEAAMAKGPCAQYAVAC